MKRTHEGRDTQGRQDVDTKERGDTLPVSWPLLNAERLEAQLCALPTDACDAVSQLRCAISSARVGDWYAASKSAQAAGSLAWEALHTGHWTRVAAGWRTFYMAAAYYMAAGSILAPSGDSELTLIDEALHTIDLGLMLGDFTFRRELLRAADSLESERASLTECGPPPRQPSAAAIINRRRSPRKLSGTLPPPPRLRLPSLPFFYNECISAAKPAILTHIIDDWPACSSWDDLAYLKAAVGHRTVPVEVGSHYLDEALDEKLMTITRFIEDYIEAPVRTLCPPRGQLGMGWPCSIQDFSAINALNAKRHACIARSRKPLMELTTVVAAERGRSDRVSSAAPALRAAASIAFRHTSKQQCV
jgi:hypothetical protein